MRGKNLPIAMEVEDVLDTFEMARAFAGKSFKINNIDLVHPPNGSMICSMVQALKTDRASVATAVEAVARDLVSSWNHGASTFLNLPLLYPDGSSVTVKIDITPTGVRVSDGGFAYREIESVGSERSFSLTARKIAEDDDVSVDRRTIYADVPLDQLYRAVCDVATASWRVADRVYQRLVDEDESEIVDHLRQRLTAVFGASHVRDENSIVGVSATKWDVSAVVQIDHKTAVFHAVSKHPNSVYRTTTAFHDISLLDTPPKLVSVVKNKAEMGHNLALLAQAGHIIEAQATDDIFWRSVA